MKSASFKNIASTQKPGGRLRRFQVKFERRQDHLAVGYGNELSSNGRFESVEDNLELAYAISVHKAQGSEFNHSYVVVPPLKGAGHCLPSSFTQR